ncbi:hypothetical protein ACX3SV_12355 [Hafnia paralvei]
MTDFLISAAELLFEWVKVAIALMLLLVVILMFLMPHVRKQLEKKKLVEPRSVIGLDLSSVKLISEPSHFMKTVDGNSSYLSNYYFDSQYFYGACDGANKQPTVFIKIPLTDIVRVNQGTTKLGNRYNWYVEAKPDCGVKPIYFFPNYTLFNKSFTEFLAAVKQVNPTAQVKNYGYFF